MSFKIAVIGCGWISMSCHGPAYARYAATHDKIELSACCDVDITRAEKFRIQFGFARSYDDYQVMLQQEKPDAVCLNVPVNWISPLGCRILQAGYPLLAEKPPGLTVQEIDLLIDATGPTSAHPAGIPHQVAFNRRFTPLISHLHGLLKDHKLQHLTYHQARIQRLDPDFTTTAVHAVDAARFLAGSDYQSIAFHYQSIPNLDQTVTNYYLDCTFENGLAAQITICPLSGVNMERAVVHCTGSTFFLSCNNGLDAPGSLQHYQEGKLVLQMTGEALSQSRDDFILNGFYAEDAAFFDAVQAGLQPELSFRSCRQSVEIMSCMRERAGGYQKAA